MQLQKSHTELFNSVVQLCNRVMLLEGSTPPQTKSSTGEDIDINQRSSTSEAGCDWDLNSSSTGGKRMTNGSDSATDTNATRDKMAAAMSKRVSTSFTSPNALSKRRKFNVDWTPD